MDVDSRTTRRKRPINLTIREDLLCEARELELNTSQAAEDGIKHAIKALREQNWLEENKDAINSHNRRIAKNGPILRPNWTSQ